MYLGHLTVLASRLAGLSSVGQVLVDLDADATAAAVAGYSGAAREKFLVAERARYGTALAVLRDAHAKGVATVAEIGALADAYEADLREKGLLVELIEPAPTVAGRTPARGPVPAKGASETRTPAEAATDEAAEATTKTKTGADATPHATTHHRKK